MMHCLQRAPLFGLNGLQDEMVPPVQMYNLVRAAQSAEVCEVVEFPNAHHMDAYDVSPDAYWASMRLFLEKHGKLPFPQIPDM